MNHRFYVPLSVVVILYGIAFQTLKDLGLPQDLRLLLSLSLSWTEVFTAIVVSYASIGLVQYLWHASSLQYPGPIAFPMIGNILSIVLSGNLQNTLTSFFVKYGKVVDIMLIEGKRYVIPFDGQFCKQAIKSVDRGDLSDASSTAWQSNFRQRFLWKELYGSYYLDLFSRSDDIGDWKSHRRILQPAFDQRHVRAMSTNIEIASWNLVKAVHDTHGTAVDALPLLEDYGLEMIFSTALGRKIDSIPDRGRFIAKYMNEMTKQFDFYQFLPFLYFTVKILPLVGLNKTELKRRKDTVEFRNFCRKLITEDVENRIMMRSPDEDNCEDRDNLLRIMASSLNDESFVIDNMIDDLSSFLFAGYDTTKVTLGNLLYHLGSNPVAQQRAFDEIKLVYDDKTSLFENVKKMPYLSACIRESQRLQPVTPALARRLHEDTPLDLGVPSKGSGAVAGNVSVVKKGTLVLIPLFVLHRDPDIYPNPNDFVPERWLIESNGDNDEPVTLRPPSPGYFFAFGGGPKMCVGFQLAEKEVKMAAAAILKNFVLVCKGNVTIVDQFVTGPEKVMMEFIPRT